MHTPLEFYVKLPEDLFRLGRKTKAKIDYIRTTPPRDIDKETWDVIVYKKNGVTFVDSKSGGLSLFNYRNPGLGNLWWKIPRGTNLPVGLHVSLDKGGKKNQHHFTVRPLYDMPYDAYIDKLVELEKFSQPCFFGVANTKVK